MAHPINKGRSRRFFRKGDECMIRGYRDVVTVKEVLRDGSRIVTVPGYEQAELVVAREWLRPVLQLVAQDGELLA